MHSYTGKFKDTMPTLKPAGILYTKSDETVKKSFEWYTIEDQIEALKHAAGIYNEKPDQTQPALKTNTSTRGLCTEISKLLQPGDWNTFEHLKDELRETTYDSYWTKPLGRGRDKVTDLPIGMDILNTRYGIKSTDPDGLADLVNPNKTEEDLLKEGSVGHENYIKSHNAYWAGEQVNRKYNCAFSDQNIFGRPTLTDRHGKYMKNSLKWFYTKNLIMANSSQVEWQHKRVYQLGKVLEPNKNFAKVAPDYVYGINSKSDVYGVNDLLNECSAMAAKELKFWLMHINKVRSLLQKRYPKFKFVDFYDSLRYYDKEKTGWLHKEIVYAVCTQFNVSFDRCKIENLLNYLDILKDDFYDIRRFVDILNLSVEFPNLPITSALPKEYQFYETTSQSSYKTDNTCDELNLPVAGVKTIRHNKNTPDINAFGHGIKAHFEHLGAESTVRSSINPSLQTIYDVTHRDYLKYRPKEQIKEIFKKIIEMSDAHFDFLWTEAEKLEDGQVNVQMIRDLLKKYAKI